MTFFYPHRTVFAQTSSEKLPPVIDGNNHTERAIARQQAESESPWDKQV